MKKTLGSKGFGAVAVFAVLLVLVGIAGVSGYVYHVKHKAQPSTSQRSGQISKKTPISNTPGTKATDPYAGWQQYCSKLEKSCFKYPADWKTGSFPVADPNGEGFSVTNPSASISLNFSSVISGLGGGCGDHTDTVISSTIQGLPSTKGIGLRTALYKDYNPYKATGQTTYRVVLGLTDNLKDEPTGSNAGCMPAPIFQSKNQNGTTVAFTNSLKVGFSFQSFDTEAEAQNLMSSADFATAQKILQSYTY